MQRMGCEGVAMLILSRKVGEEILIGDHIVVTITQVDRGGQVRVGIKAPPEMRIDRPELRARINREKMRA
jgi:carbon storage regulator